MSEMALTIVIYMAKAKFVISKKSRAKIGVFPIF